MSEHRNAIASILLDPRYTNTGLTLVELFEKVKGLGLFPTKEHLSKVLSKMHDSNLVKRSIATQTYGSRWSITIKGRDLYRGAFDYAEEKLEMVDAKLQSLDVKLAINEVEAEIKAAANALSESDVIAASEYLDDGVKTKPALSSSVDEFLNKNHNDGDDDLNFPDDFGQALFKLGFLHQKEIEAAKKQCPIKNLTQKIEQLKQINEAIKLLTKQNVQVIDDLIDELSILL